MTDTRDELTQHDLDSYPLDMRIYNCVGTAWFSAARWEDEDITRWVMIDPDTDRVALQSPAPTRLLVTDRFGPYRRTRPDLG